MTTEPLSQARVAVLIPCFNEAPCVAGVVHDFRSVLPSASIYVYDNNSTDETIANALGAGAIVRREPRQGKGHVVRRMFADVEADVYVLVDGDATYSAASGPKMIRMLFEEDLDMVVGSRSSGEAHAFRSGHLFGNALLNRVVSSLFGKRFTDILSGYRVCSRRFVKSFPALTKGFEIETELSVHALELRLPVSEIATPYGARMPGSSSKLSTYRDGFRILWMIFALYKHEKPLRFFGWIAAILMAIALALGIPVVVEWLHTGLVPRLPTAVLATGIVLVGFLSLTVGLVLETVTRGRQEFKRLIYLQTPRGAPGGVTAP